MGWFGHVKRFQYDGMYFKVYPEMIYIFKSVGLEPIFQRFNRYNLSLCHDFVFSFDGNIARIKTLRFPIIEDLTWLAIGEATFVSPSLFPIGVSLAHYSLRLE